MGEEQAEWVGYLKQYETNRSNLPWKSPPPVERVRHSDIKARECSYNPITQVYTNQDFVTFNQEHNVRQDEEKRFIHTLAKNKDRALRYEQTFDIVNLENKLKGLEGKPGYPEEKKRNYNKKDVGYTTTHYNIISNLDFKDHHYLPPDQRPQPPAEKPREYQISAVEYRDFDIITNRYLQSHDEKTKLDQVQFKQEAAVKYWNTHDYDPIRVTYVDEEKEEDFNIKRAEEAKIHGKDQIERLPYGIKYSESALYQPINMRVVDEQRLYEIDMKNKLAKQRYEARYDLERDYRIRDIEEQDRGALQSINKINHKRFAETRERGYNIVNNVPYEGRFGKPPVPLPTKPRAGVWEKAQAYSLAPSSAPSQGGSQSGRSAVLYVNEGKVAPKPASSVASSIRTSGFKRA